MSGMSRLGVWAGVAAAAGLGVGAQMHKVARPETVVRAVGVYEWTGELAKPKGLRLVPVTIFIDGQVQDAAVYLSRPVPMALDSGTVYELDDAGVPKGLVDVKEARHVQIPAAAELAPYDGGAAGVGRGGSGGGVAGGCEGGWRGEGFGRCRSAYAPAAATGRSEGCEEGAQGGWSVVGDGRGQVAERRSGPAEDEAEPGCGRG
jgi:hypothetical protein